MSPLKIIEDKKNKITISENAFIINIKEKLKRNIIDILNRWWKEMQSFKSFLEKYMCAYDFQ